MALSKTNKAGRLLFKTVFFCLFIFSLLMGIFLTSIVKNNSKMYAAKTDYIENWTVIDQAGNTFETGRTYNDERAYHEDFTIISRLPTAIWHDSVLCFMNRSNVRVYINGELRKDFDRIRDTGIPGGSMKEFYLTVPLSTSDSGGELKIERSKTDWNPVICPETFITSAEGVYDYLVNKYGSSFVMTVVLFVAALIATVIGIVLRIWQRHTIDMLYGALGILDVACWLISVSQLTPFFTRIYYVDGILGFLFCMMMPFALLIYINSIQKERYKFCHTTLFIISLISFILWTTLHFTGIQSFQSSLIYIDIELGIVVFCVLVTLILDLKNHHIKEYPYSAVGFLIFLIMCTIEIIMIIFFPERSNELPILVGLMFMLTFVVIKQVYDIRKVRKHLEGEIQNKNMEKEQMLIHIVETLAGTIDAKDTYTNGHSSRVADYSKEIARRYGYNDSELNDIYMMGLLHDIGKIGIPDAVINKPGKLTDEEYNIIKKHPVMGAKILDNIKEKPELSTGARWHHEKYDGKGYPDGIKGSDIPEQARIIAVADAYDAMTSYRSYRDPLDQNKVRQEIKNGSGTQFDPRFASIMLEMIDEDKNYKLREHKTDDGPMD